MSELPEAVAGAEAARGPAEPGGAAGLGGPIGPGGAAGSGGDGIGPEPAGTRASAADDPWAELDEVATGREAPGTGREEDRFLVLRAQDGDVAAFERLVDRHQARLFRTAYMLVGDRQDAEDVVQDTLVQAWRRIELLEEPAAFRGWVSQICARRATDLVRRLARRATRSHADEDLELAAGNDPDGLRGGADRPPDPELSAEVSAQLRALADVLADLDEPLRTCWVLREVEELPYREIARITGATETTVRGRLARARQQIIERMEGWR